MSTLAPTPARELSAEEQQERALTCRKIEEGIMQDIATGRGALWLLAAKCYQFNQEEGWSALGYESQNEWLAQPEIGMSRTMFFRLVRKHRELRVFRDIPEETLMLLDHSKIDMVLPIIETNARPIEQVLDDVKTLGARDLREEYVGVVNPRAPAGSQNGSQAPGDNEPTKEELAAQKASEEAQKALDQVNASAAMVDSWLELGGDKRKASRHWKRVLEDHPFFQAMHEIEKTLEGVEGALPREELASQWRRIKATLKFKFPEA